MPSYVLIALLTYMAMPSYVLIASLTYMAMPSHGCIATDLHGYGPPCLHAQVPLISLINAWLNGYIYIYIYMYRCLSSR